MYTWEGVRWFTIVVSSYLCFLTRAQCNPHRAQSQWNTSGKTAIFLGWKIKKNEARKLNAKESGEITLGKKPMKTPQRSVYACFWPLNHMSMEQNKSFSQRLKKKKQKPDTRAATLKVLKRKCKQTSSGWGIDPNLGVGEMELYK